MRRRVVITGIGCVTPMGTDVERVWEGLKHGESGVGYTTVFDASNFPTKISAEVRGFDVSEVGEDPEVWRLRGRHTKFAIGAAKKAVADSGIEDAATRSDPFWRLSGQRRRTAGFRLLHPHDGQRAEGRPIRSGAVHQGRPGRASPRWRSWNKSRTCRPGIWPPPSTPRAPTATA